MRTKSETLYRKVGRRYHPVAEQMLREAHILSHEGSWLVRSEPGSVTWRAVKPDYAKIRHVLEGSVRELLVGTTSDEWNRRMTTPTSVSEDGHFKTFKGPDDVATAVIERIEEFLAEQMNAKSSANDK